MKTITKLWIFIAILIVLAPVGLILPEYLKSGAAWGEWSSDEIKNIIGYIPRGIAVLSTLWNSPMPGYAFKNSRNNALPASRVEYILSAAIGVLIILAIMLLIGRFLQKRNGIDSKK